MLIQQAYTTPECSLTMQLYITTSTVTINELREFIQRVKKRKKKRVTGTLTAA